MEKKIRSISMSYGIDEKLILDSKSRGLTISANITKKTIYICLIFTFFLLRYSFIEIVLSPIQKKILEAA